MSVATGRFCPACGSPVAGDERFCSSCGASLDAGNAPPPDAGGRSSGKATLSLIFGMLGIVILPMVFSILAVALGVMAKREIRSTPDLRGNGRATAGIVIGAVGVALLPLWAAYLLNA